MINFINIYENNYLIRNPFRHIYISLKREIFAIELIIKFDNFENLTQIRKKKPEEQIKNKIKLLFWVWYGKYCISYIFWKQEIN